VQATPPLSVIRPTDKDIRIRSLALAAPALSLAVVPLVSQAPASSPHWATVRLDGALAYKRVTPVPGGGSLDEARLVRPVAIIDVGVLGGRLRLQGAFNFEGCTIEDGELSLGAWGEGFVDRRHPHTYVHEIMLSAVDLLDSLDGAANLSLSVGKGFVAFGTDDPMSRPALRFPVNHHWSQVLERAVVIAGLRVGPMALEGSLFNGDEPERPGQWPRIGNRFGDSRALRVTVFPATGIELQGSHAMAASPEHRSGTGPDQFKWSASARWARPIAGHPAYGLVEWARTSEVDGFFVFNSFLAEGQYRLGRHRMYYQFERTERPEEERLLDLFRSPRPHHDDNIIGITRWTLHTAGYGIDLSHWTGLGVEPFMEVSLGRVSQVGAGLFDPEGFYGRRSLSSVSLGARIAWSPTGDGPHRMGRYGVLLPDRHWPVDSTNH
jgi:hypothetical protein